MPNHVTNVISFSGDKSRISAMLKEIQNDEHGIGSVDFEKILPMPDTVYNGSLGIRERELYGENNWYDWRLGNWGTKWNSYGYTENTTLQDDKIKFLTAWSAPHPILHKLSEMYPDVKMEHEWADEDIGMNCGRYVYYDGERVEEYFPESQKECLEFAAKVMDVSLEEDYSLYLNASETGYVNIEYDDEYELVEIEDLPALFTNERITDADIPKGMYCYHIRHDDNGNFCAIEKNVTVNHAGSIITKEPIELGKQGYISLNQDNSPNFFGENMSIYMFREYDPDQSEEMSMGMTEV
ncbi:LPD28 domain-containing protein [uncultured Ruminococcus sp.]|uniref:LPD28 domain-containing protein n=1 Tax=uncultured Ruminococcus sp. TaxID=165186 RepID=UPI00262088F4|nr:LPD28 domain-containing protein [uncultured Ruminococcus sp.]